MGAVESSTLESVETLSRSLAEIERKLTSIEDVHLHHDRTICHDEVIVICGKRVQCRSAVKLLVGPVIGVISPTSARILLETDRQTELTLNTFHIDEHISEGRFLKTQKHTIAGQRATAFTIEDLLPGTRYGVYVGGIHPRDTLMKYANFNTLPRNTGDLRVAVLSQGQGGLEVPGEDDLWSRLVMMTAESGDIWSRAGETAKSVLSSVDEKAGSVADTVDDRACDLPSPALHFVVHTGDFVSVDAAVRRAGLKLLEILSRDDAGDATWEPLVTGLEDSLLHLYRSAFGNVRLQPLFRRCGNVFLTGPTEAALGTADLLGVPDAGPGVTGVPEREAEEKAERERLEEEEREIKKYGVKVIKKMVVQPNRSESKDSDDDDAANSSLTGFEDALHKEVRRLGRGILARTEVQVELRRMILALLLRVARRFQWRYMRQLWDEDFARLESEDLRVEAAHREILKMKRVFWVKTDVHRTLRQTLRKMEDQVGKDLAAIEQIKSCVEAARIDMDDAESAINNTASDAFAVDEAHHGVLLMGSVLLVLLELNWGWLTPGGEVHPMTRTNIAISRQTWEALESALAISRGDSGMSLGNSQSSEAGITKEIDCHFRTVFVVASSPLLPTGAPANLVPKTVFSLSGPELDDLLGCLARWQSGDSQRAVLIVQGGTGFAGCGWLLPPSNDDDEDDHSHDRVWEDRSQLRLLAVGTMVIPPGPSPLAMSKLKPLPSTLTYSCSYADSVESESSRTLFSSQLEVATDGGLGRRSFWIVKPLDRCAPTVGARFDLSLVSDSDGATNSGIPSTGICLGPIVGSLTCTSARILLESALTASFSVFVVDQVTGIEYVVQRFMLKKRATIITVEGLLPDRPYSVHCLRQGDVTDSGDRAQAVFTTPSEHAEGSGSAPVGREAERRAIRDTRVATKCGSLLNSGTESETRADDSQDAVWPDVLRIAVLGGCGSGVVDDFADPWIRAPVATENADSYAGERSRVAEGYQLMRTLTYLQTNPWNPVSLAMLLGSTVDVGFGCRAASAVLVAAEKEPVGSTEQNRLLECADAHIRDAYRIHWGGCGPMRELLLAGSYVALSDTAADLCAAFGGSTCIEQLKRFVVSNLLGMADSARKDYQSALWSEAAPSPAISVQYLRGGTVAVLGLSPHWESQLAGAGLISGDQWRALETLLQAGGASGASLRVLVVASPIPFIAAEPGHSGHALLSINKPGVRYSVDELIRLFDLLRVWIKEGDWEAYRAQGDRGVNSSGKARCPRQVMLVCGGAPVPYTTRVEGFTIKRGEDALAKQDAEFCISQVCTSPVTGGCNPLSAPETAATQSGQMFAPPTRTRAGMRFQFSHTIRPSTAYPECIVIEVRGEPINDSSGSTEPGRETSVSAAGPPEALHASVEFHSCNTLEEIMENGSWTKSPPREVAACLEEAGLTVRNVEPAAGDGCSDMDLIRSAIRVALGTEACTKVLRDAHGLLTSGEYGLLTNSSGETAVVRVMGPLLTWTRHALVEAGADDVLLGRPSAVLLAHVWGLFARPPTTPNENGESDADEWERVKRTRPRFPQRAGILSGNEEVFMQFVKDVFETSAILQYFGTSLNDGW